MGNLDAVVIPTFGHLSQLCFATSVALFRELISSVPYDSNIRLSLFQFLATYLVYVLQSLVLSRELISSGHYESN